MESAAVKFPPAPVPEPLPTPVGKERLYPIPFKRCPLLGGACSWNYNPCPNQGICTDLVEEQV